MTEKGHGGVFQRNGNNNVKVDGNINVNGNGLEERVRHYESDSALSNGMAMATSKGHRITKLKVIERVPLTHTLDDFD